MRATHGLRPHLVETVIIRVESRKAWLVVLVLGPVKLDLLLAGEESLRAYHVLLILLIAVGQVSWPVLVVDLVTGGNSLVSI